VKGLGIAPGARRPGAKKTAAPSQPAPAAPAPKTEPEPAAEPEPDASEGNGEAATPPVKGLGIAKGARPPGKR
jgi:hypothetical protein